MLIVPDNDVLKVETKVRPEDIDQVRSDQAVLMRFSAFNQRTTPQLNGTVSWIAPDLTEDKHTGLSYYTVRINVSDERNSAAARPQAHSRECRWRPSSKPAAAPCSLIC